MKKVLQLSILNLDIDLISINLASKLSFYLKFKTLNNATEKGINLKFVIVNYQATKQWRRRIY